MSLLPPEEPRQYGFFGYRGEMCDRAIRQDNPDMLRECIERGFIDRDSEMLMGGTIKEFCERKAPKCAAMLQELWA